MYYKIIILFLSFVGIVNGENFKENNQFLGCFKFNSNGNSSKFINIEGCLKQCSFQYFKYAIVNSMECACRNYLGDEMDATAKCGDYCRNCGQSDRLYDTYTTGISGNPAGPLTTSDTPFPAPGPPTNLAIVNVTDQMVHVAWTKPVSLMQILSYQIKAKVLHTYSDTQLYDLEWIYPNDTFHAVLNLQPATNYNITVRAVSGSGKGPETYRVIETELGEPDNKPDKPDIIRRDGNRMIIKLKSVTNNKGPVSDYLVIVINADTNPVFDENFLKSYNEAKDENIDYYLAAKLKPDEILAEFTVGDGHYYGGYFNAPLDSQINYDVIVGVVSTLKGSTRTIYGQHQTDNVQQLFDNNESPIIIIILSIAIAILSLILIATIIGFLLLKKRVTHRRQRLSDNQELTLQGPMIEVENNGYIPEEEHHTKESHYKYLKQKLSPIDYVDLNIGDTLSDGKFGKYKKGIYLDRNVVIYTIHDKKLHSEDKKVMLKDLDLLIKSGKNDHIISLIGTCETPLVLLVVLDYYQMNLKDFLLGSRDTLSGKFSNLSEKHAFSMALDIIEGMIHLESLKIIHRQLCARSILITDNLTPKIGDYGLAQYQNHNNLSDYTRWTAMEVFRGQPANGKSDVWSYGCLLWEICVLGGTPYGNFPNNEIPERVMKGLRLQQMQYFSDELYQIMLSCWQIDMDERPTFRYLKRLMVGMRDNSALIPFISFDLYQQFQYEQYYPNMEMAVRPLF